MTLAAQQQHFVSVLSPAKEVPSYLELIVLLHLDVKKACKVRNEQPPCGQHRCSTICNKA